MTGTPGGVGLFMTPKTFLKDGDEVSVSISELGTLKNVMRFA
jgi:transcription initiation factor TFIIH subunit 2